MVASKFSSRSRTNASWLMDVAARSCAVSPLTLPTSTDSLTGLPKCSASAERSFPWYAFSARCFADGAMTSVIAFPSKLFSSLCWASCLAGKGRPVAVETSRERARSAWSRRPLRYRRGSLRGRRGGTAPVGHERDHAQQAHGETGVVIRRQRQILPTVHRYLVVELHIFGAQPLRQRKQALPVRQFVGQRLGRNLGQRDAVQQRCQILQRTVEGDVARFHVAGCRQRRRRVSLGNRFQHSVKKTIVHRAEHGAHRRLAHIPRRVGNRLVQQRQRVAHAAAGGCRNEPERRILALDLLFCHHALQVLRDRRRGHLLEVELQAAR